MARVRENGVAVVVEREAPPADGPPPEVAVDTKPAKPRRGLSAEMAAMTRLDRIVGELLPDERCRAVEWLFAKYCAKPRAACGE